MTANLARIFDKYEFRIYASTEEPRYLVLKREWVSEELEVLTMYVVIEELYSGLLFIEHIDYADNCVVNRLSNTYKFNWGNDADIYNLVYLVELVSNHYDPSIRSFNMLIFEDDCKDLFSYYIRSSSISGSTQTQLFAYTKGRFRSASDLLAFQTGEAVV